MTRSLSFFFFLLTLPTLAIAGAIKGRVTEPGGAEAAIGAAVSLLEAQDHNAVTGLDGSFRIGKVSAGTYTLSITYIGASAYTQTIALADDQELSLDINLRSPQDKQLQEVVIGGKRDGGSENTARTMEQKADQVMNIISAKAIQVSPDLTVANVIQRVSGVSIERNSNGDGQFAILRGMDKRYNYTLVNGVKIPSPDNKYRYVPLDMFPSELLDRLEVYKALTPDMEGDAIGGAINMVMKDAPDRLTLSANLATGYSELFAGRDFMSYNSGGINKQSPYEIQGKNYSAVTSDFPSAPLDYQQKRPLPNLLGGLSLGNRFFGGKLGVLVAGSYQNTHRGANSTFFDQETVDTFKGVTLTNRHVRRFSEQQIRSGLHAIVDYRISKKHKLRWYNAYMSLTNIQVRDEVIQSLGKGTFDPVNGNAELQYSTRSRLTQQRIYNSTLQGDHQLGDALKLQWSAVYSRATSEQPDNTRITLNGVENGFVQQITSPDGMSRRWEHNSDRDLSGYLNLSYDHRIAGIPIEWKLGGLYRDKQRTNFYNQYQFTPLNTKAQYGVDFTDYSDIDWYLGTPKGSVGSALNYDAYEKITAGFLRFKLQAAMLEVTGGVRIEHTDQGYAMLSQAGEDHPTGNQVYTDVLPSLHFRYMPSPATNIRASYYRAINRPGFFEIVPYKIVEEDYQERGNYNLQHAIADNIDLRYELFPRAGEMLMAGVFYKHIQNPIEYTLQLDPVRQQDVYYAPGNYGNANNYGLELDFIKYFQKFGVKGNYTYTHSRITTNKFERIRNAQGDLAPSTVMQSRPLYGQAAHIANLSLLYKDAQHGWDAQLAANYTGDRIVTISQFLDRDIWQKGFVQLDCSVEKTFKNHIGIFAKVNNILNTPMQTYIKGQTAVNAGVPDQDMDGNTMIQKDLYQRSYLLGLRYKL
ncbi:TonB-dependent receptor domain-containing protein [Taibaiella koreensis]|uniref:TonB-dependent receptor domain-containing protein n=1 Tax=Taibaiella koreensis TaxID=1268548 RepID=UPI000E59E5BD|nr:TonB-dependent receptor [Taibaiella koreensis]